MSTRCTRCVYDDTVPHIVFDAQGVCNYCHAHDDLCAQFPTGQAGEAQLQSTAADIKKAGKGKKFDCVVGVSGGCDSSYLLYVAKEVMGLRPLAVHFDNTWNSTIATENMHRIVEQLGVPLEVYRVDAHEYEDLYRSFLKAGVPDIEAQTDIGLAAVLRGTAEKHGIRYVLDGHNFRTEGLCPLGWLYMDGKYISSVHAQYGSVPLRTYPNMTLTAQLRWMLLRRIRNIRPLWNTDYNKDDVKTFLHETFGWQWYGGHHLENRFTAFFHSYFMPVRYGIDTRLLGFAAMVRAGKMPREEALAELAKPFYLEPNLIEYVTQRLNIDEAQLADWMQQAPKTYRDFPTYKQTFEKMRPFFWLMAKLQLIPYSFYLKYTAPDPQNSPNPQKGDRA